MAALTRLHEETERLRRYFHPMPDLITFTSNDVADRLRRHVRSKQSDESEDTVYVNLKVNSEEDLPPKYINLYVDTKRDITARYIQLDNDADYVDTKVIYLNINSAGMNNRPSSAYPHYRRHRQNN